MIRSEIVARMKQTGLARFGGEKRHSIVQRSLQDEDSGIAEVFVDGASNIFGKPEFSDTEMIRGCSDL